MVCIMFLYKSHRWLIFHDRLEEALVILAKYHSDNDPNAPIFQLQHHEIMEDNVLTRDDNPWRDYCELFDAEAAR